MNNTKLCIFVLILILSISFIFDIIFNKQESFTNNFNVNQFKPGWCGAKWHKDSDYPGADDNRPFGIRKGSFGNIDVMNAKNEELRQICYDRAVSKFGKTGFGSIMIATEAGPWFTRGCNVFTKGPGENRGTGFGDGYRRLCYVNPNYKFVDPRAAQKLAAQEEARKRAEEARKKAEEERKRIEEVKRKKAEQEAAKKRAEAEARLKAAEEKRKQLEAETARKQKELEAKIAAAKAAAQKKMEDSLRREKEANARLLSERDSTARQELAQRIALEKAERDRLVSEKDAETRRLLAQKDAETKKILEEKQEINREILKAFTELQNANSILQKQIEESRRLRDEEETDFRLKIAEQNKEREIAIQEKKELDERLKRLQNEWAAKDKASQSANLKLKDSLKLAEIESQELQLSLNAEIQKFENERMKREAVRLEVMQAQSETDRLSKLRALEIKQNTEENNRIQEIQKRRLNALIEREKAEAERIKQEKEKRIAELTKQRLEKEAIIRQKEYEAKLAAEKRKIEIEKANAKALEEALKLARSKAEARALDIAHKSAQKEIARLNQEIQKYIELATREIIALEQEIAELEEKIRGLKINIENTENKLEWTENELQTCSLFTSNLRTRAPYLI